MSIENQSVATSSDDQITSARQLMYRIYVWIIIILLCALQLLLERISIVGLIHGELVDIHVFICTIGGVWMLGAIVAMSRKHINQRNSDSHAGIAFISAILITAGIAVLHGNAKHAYIFHSVTGFVCLSAVWIQFILGLTVVSTSANEKDGPRWPMVAHIIVGFTTVISIALCFISGYETAWFYPFYAFLSDRKSVLIGFSVFTAVTAVLVLTLPFYKIIREVTKYFRGST